MFTCAGYIFAIIVILKKQMNKTDCVCKGFFTKT